MLSCYADKVDYYSKGTVEQGIRPEGQGALFPKVGIRSSRPSTNVVLIVTDQQDVKLPSSSPLSRSAMTKNRFREKRKHLGHPEDSMTI